MSRYRPKLFEEETQQAMSRVHESSAAKSHGGQVVRGSGCSVYAKGDVKQRSTGGRHDPVRFLFECKTTGDKSMRVTAHWLAKITREAAAEALEPALEFEIRGGNDPMCESQWVAVPRSVFMRLQQEALEGGST